MAGPWEPVDPLWLPKFMTTPTKFTGKVSRHTKRILKARKEAYWVLKVVELAIREYSNCEEIQRLMSAYFSTSYEVDKILRLLRSTWSGTFMQSFR